MASRNKGAASAELLPLDLAHLIPKAIDLHLGQPGIKAQG
jgi:hypothetical protein